MGIKLVRIRDQRSDRSNWHTNRCQNSCLTKLQAARVVHTDKNVPINYQAWKQDGNEHMKKKGPSPEILSVWWPCCTACASAPRKSTAARMAMAKAHRLIFFSILPTRPQAPSPASTRCLCLYSPLRPSPCPLLWARQPPGVIKRRDPSQREAFPPIFLLPSSVWWGASEKVSGGFPRLPSSFLQRTPSFGKK